MGLSNYFNYFNYFAIDYMLETMFLVSYLLFSVYLNLYKDVKENAYFSKLSSENNNNTDTKITILVIIVQTYNQQKTVKDSQRLYVNYLILNKALNFSNG